MLFEKIHKERLFNRFILFVRYHFNCTLHFRLKELYLFHLFPTLTFFHCLLPTYINVLGQYVTYLAYEDYGVHFTIVLTVFKFLDFLLKNLKTKIL